MAHRVSPVSIKQCIPDLCYIKRVSVYAPSKSNAVGTAQVGNVCSLAFMAMRKQLLSCGLGVPALKRVGEACVNHRSLKCRYVATALSISCKPQKPESLATLKSPLASACKLGRIKKSHLC